MQEFVEIDDCTVKCTRKIIPENNNFFTFCLKNTIGVGNGWKNVKELNN